MIQEQERLTWFRAAKSDQSHLMKADEIFALYDHVFSYWELYYNNAIKPERYSYGAVRSKKSNKNITTFMKLIHESKLQG